MKAFVNCKVSKDEVLGSLKMHQAADHFIRGQYWEDGKGCSMGCTIHDFAPGKEDNHSLYPELFGLPESFAYLQDRIFEGLPLEDSKKWSVNVISAIPEGCDVSKKIDEFVYWILSGGDSPISEYRDKKEIKAVAELYRRKLAGESIKREEWKKAEDDAKASSRADAVYIVDTAPTDATYTPDAVYYDAAADTSYYTTAAYYATHAAYFATDAGTSSYAVYAAIVAYYAAHAANVYVYATDVAFQKMSDKLINILKGN